MAAVLRKFSFTDKSASGVEQWKQPLYQERRRSTDGAISNTAQSAPIKKKAASAKPRRLDQGRVAIQLSQGPKQQVKAVTPPTVPQPPPAAVPPLPPSSEVSLVTMNEESNEYQRVKRLATRFLNPDHGNSSVVSRYVSAEVESITAIRCPMSQAAFDDRRRSLHGPNYPIVTKLLPDFPPSVLKHGAFTDDEFEAGELGKGLYFPNVFSSHDDIHHSALDERKAGELLLCTVAPGMSKVVSSSFSVPSVGDVLSGGTDGRCYDSICGTINGTPNLVLYNAAQVLPTHIVRFRREPTQPCASPFGKDYVGESAADQVTSEGQGNAAEKNKGEEQAGDDVRDLQVQINKAVALIGDRKAHVVEESRRIQKIVVQQCRDLETAISARRDWLVASIRKMETTTLTALSNYERALQAPPRAFASGPQALETWKATVESRIAALEIDGDPAPSERLGAEGRDRPPSRASSSETNKLSNPFEGMKLDTCRILMLIDGLNLSRCTSTRPPIPRPGGANGSRPSTSQGGEDVNWTGTSLQYVPRGSLSGNSQHSRVVPPPTEHDINGIGKRPTTSPSPMFGTSMSTVDFRTGKRGPSRGTEQQGGSVAGGSGSAAAKMAAGRRSRYGPPIGDL